MVVKGAGLLHGLSTLGDNVQGMGYNEALGIYEMQQGDNSMLILLSGVAGIVVTIAFISVWAFSIFSGEAARVKHAAGRRVNNFIQDIKSLTNENVRFLLLSVPVAGLSIFTVMPLLYMILMVGNALNIK